MGVGEAAENPPTAEKQSSAPTRRRHAFPPLHSPIRRMYTPPHYHFTQFTRKCRQKPRGNAAMGRPEQRHTRRGGGCVAGHGGPQRGDLTFEGRGMAGARGVRLPPRRTGALRAAKCGLRPANTEQTRVRVRHSKKGDCSPKHIRLAGSQISPVTVCTRVRVVFGRWFCSVFRCFQSIFRVNSADSAMGHCCAGFREVSLRLLNVVIAVSLRIAWPLILHSTSHHVGVPSRFYSLCVFVVCVCFSCL